MLHIHQLYAVLLLSAVLISAALVVTVLRYRPTLGTHSFAVLMSAVAMWAFLTVFEVISQDLPTKIFSGQLKYACIVTVPVAWFVFSLYYSNRIKHLNFKFLALLSAVPLATIVMTATNDIHHLMFQSIQWHRSDNLLVPLRQFGPWFWIHTTYSYALLLLGFLFLARTFIDTQRIYRRQSVSLLFAALAPWLCNILFLSGTRSLPSMDLTPFAFTLSGLALMWGILKYRLLDVVPIARDIIIQNMRDGIVVLDNDHRILDLNQTAADLIGEPQQVLIGRSAEQAIAWWPHLPANGNYDALQLTTVIAVPDKGHLHLQISASALQNDGKSLGHLISLQDITELRANQEAIRQSEDRFKAISENAPVIILSLDDTGKFTYVNPSWQNILGHARNEVIGRPFTDLVADPPVKTYNDLFERLLSGKERLVEGYVNFKHQSEGHRTFNFTASVNSDFEGRITGIICVAKDVTEEERLRTQLFQSQKMEAIGTLAGGIAHDFNNLLMGMQANISLLRLENDAYEKLQDKFKRIEDQIQSGASLTRQLLGYARKGKYVVAPMDIRRPIEEALQVVQRTNKHIRVHRDLNSDPCIVEADQGQIELALLNLLVNAADAMPKGGDLTVAVHRMKHVETSDQWPELKPGDYVCITVADTGIGMDPSTLERIFEPFFTTKEIGRGTGLGLASVYGVVQNHNGHIHVQSQVGIGSTFTVLFPAAALTAVPAPRKRAPEAISRGGYVLLADGDPHIRQCIAEMVRSLGFIDLSTGSSHEAFILFEQNYPFIDGVILDIHLHEETLPRLQAIEPGIKVIFTGMHEIHEEMNNLWTQGHRLLTKPFTRDELAHAIAETIRGKAMPIQSNPPSSDPLEN
jgi:PAS domain S-box-containing protein